MKALELHIYPQDIDHHGNGAYLSADGSELFEPVTVAAWMAELKHFTDAELAAEYYRTAWLYSESVGDNDGYDGMAETREYRRQSQVLNRFIIHSHALEGS